VSLLATGATAGRFSATPAGLALDSITGQIRATGSLPGRWVATGAAVLAAVAAAALMLAWNTQQRVKALEAFLADIYGDAEIVRDGVLPRRLITSCEHFHRAAAGLVPVAPEADYPALYPVSDAAAARALAARVEDDCAGAWRYLYAQAATTAQSKKKRPRPLPMKSPVKPK
jgi:hypothetical protein